MKKIMIKPIEKYKAPKKRKQRKPKTEKELLEDELTQLWKDKSYQLLERKCIVCEDPLSTWHHYIPKGKCLRLKYDIKNSIPICQKCHYNVHFSYKPTIVADIINKIRKVRGRSWEAYIKKHEHDKVKREMKWLLEQKERLLKL